MCISKKLMDIIKIVNYLITRINSLWLPRFLLKKCKHDVKIYSTTRNSLVQQRESSQVSIWSTIRNVSWKEKKSEFFNLMTMNGLVDIGFVLIFWQTLTIIFNLWLQGKDQLVHRLFDQVKASVVKIHLQKTQKKRTAFKFQNEVKVK